MDLRKFFMDELKKVSETLKKYEDAYLGAAAPGAQPVDSEYLKSSIEYYRGQVSLLRTAILDTKGQSL